MPVLARLVGAIRDGRWSDLRDVAAAQLALLRAQLVLWTRARGALVGTVQWDAGGGGGEGEGEGEGEIGGMPDSTAETQRVLCERLSHAVTRAARMGLFRPRCLARAVALSNLLTAHGVSGHRIRIGVRRENGAVIAHAWVELGAWVLGDTLASTRSYAPLPDVRIAAGP